MPVGGAVEAVGGAGVALIGVAVLGVGLLRTTSQAVLGKGAGSGDVGEIAVGPQVEPVDALEAAVGVAYLAIGRLLA